MFKINKGIHVNDITVLHPFTQSRIAKDMVLRWCHSDDPETNARHLPTVPGIDEPGEHREVGAALLPYARTILADRHQPQRSVADRA